MRTILITKTIGRQHQNRTPDTSYRSLIAQIQAYPTISYPYLTPVLSHFKPLSFNIPPQSALNPATIIKEYDYERIGISEYS